jgi:hypothetical protein
MSAVRRLAALLGAADGGHIAVPSLLTGSAWEPLLELAGERGVMPLLWSASLRLGLLEPVPSHLLDALGRGVGPRRHAAAVLQLAHRGNAARNADLMEQFDDVIAVLSSAGIPVVALKGTGHIARGVWPDPADRSMRDIDVLVPSVAAPDAQERLIAAGYKAGDRHREPDQHHLATLYRPGRFGSVEVHKEPVSRGFTKAVRGSDVIAAARPVPGRPSVLVPSPTHAAVIALVHAYLADGQWRERTIPLRSVHELWRLDALEPVDWAEVRTLLRRIWRGQLVAEHLATAASLLGAEAPAASVGVSRARLRLRVAESPASRVTRPFDMIASGFDAGRLRRYYGTGVGGPWRLRALHAKRILRRLVSSGRATAQRPPPRGRRAQHRDR